MSNLPTFLTQIKEATEREKARERERESEREREREREPRARTETKERPVDVCCLFLMYPSRAALLEVFAAGQVDECDLACAHGERVVLVHRHIDLQR